MNTQTHREIRFGLIALVLTGILCTLGVALRGALLTDPDSLMQAALSSNFVPSVTISLVCACVLAWKGWQESVVRTAESSSSIRTAVQSARKRLVQQHWSG